ncbi:MAG: hypothetical protein NZ873_01765 [Crenarchaeota archaeon]|nr:hypothetical protein [Thermoproteota archaeon]MDW8034194.1 hypothetical protein [Nitrososphaerota archaeon]
MNITGALFIILLASLQPVGEVETVSITVVLKISPGDPFVNFVKSNFRVYVNGSSNIYGVELKVNSSRILVFKVPKGSYLRITGEPEVVSDYGFWYKLENVNGSRRVLEFKADNDALLYLNYSINHVLLSPYFIAVYILLSLLAIRKHLPKK